MTDSNHPFDAAAYGGPGWSPRLRSLQQELGTVWAACGISSEWGPLKSVLLHSPGEELNLSATPDDVQMLSPLDLKRAIAQHHAMADAYRTHGVEVHHLEPRLPPQPNLMFVADLLFMTPEGAIVGRPASTVRAGEERQLARRISELGIPILRSIGGKATFEGADAAWIDDGTVLIGRGLRTNTEGIGQVAEILEGMGVDLIPIDLPYGTMHLMGVLRIVDADLAIAWPGRLAHRAVALLQSSGMEVLFLPDVSEARNCAAFGFVTLGPRHILMPAGNPLTRRFFEKQGIVCQEVAVDELTKAAGAIGCLTGILHRGAP